MPFLLTSPQLHLLSHTDQATGLQLHSSSKQTFSFAVKITVLNANPFSLSKSNAAAVLVGMNRIFNLKLSQKDMMERGVKLGADVPYCVMRGTVLAEGIGEVLTPLPSMPKCCILIAKPGINVSTKVVYEKLDCYRYS